MTNANTSVLYAFYVTAAFLVLATVLFMVSEPVVTRAQTSATDQFTVTQEITTEIAFITPVNDVTMSGTIAGITGGITNGQTQVRIATNNTTGYSLEVDFASSSYGTAAMNRDGGSGSITDYAVAAPGVPDFTFDSGESFAQFGFTVSASTTADIDTRFRNSSSACNDGGGIGEVSASCWYGPSSTAVTLINTSSATPASGSTSTIHFRVDVPSNPSPVIPPGFYTATATLTAITN